MLAALESLLVAAIADALSDREVVADAGDPPPPGRRPQVVIAATSIELALAEAAPRGPVHHLEVRSWPDAAGALELPGSARGALLEVEAPLGLLLRAGDDYSVEDGHLRLFRPPSRSGVRARIGGRPLRGHVDRTPARLGATATIWADTRPLLDLVSARVRAALARLAASPRVLVSEVDTADLGVEGRLLGATLRWGALRRDAPRVDGMIVLRDRIEIEVRGDLEERVVLGEDLTAGIIREVRRSP